MAPGIASSHNIGQQAKLSPGSRPNDPLGTIRAHDPNLATQSNLKPSEGRSNLRVWVWSDLHAALRIRLTYGCAFRGPCSGTGKEIDQGFVVAFDVFQVREVRPRQLKVPCARDVRG